MSYLLTNRFNFISPRPTLPEIYCQLPAYFYYLYHHDHVFNMTIKQNQIHITIKPVTRVSEWITRSNLLTISSRFEDAEKTGYQDSILILHGLTQCGDHGCQGLLSSHTCQPRTFRKQKPVWWTWIDPIENYYRCRRILQIKKQGALNVLTNIQCNR